MKLKHCDTIMPTLRRALWRADTWDHNGNTAFDVIFNNMKEKPAGPGFRWNAEDICKNYRSKEECGESPKYSQMAVGMRAFTIIQTTRAAFGQLVQMSDSPVAMNLGVKIDDYRYIVEGNPEWNRRAAMDWDKLHKAQYKDGCLMYGDCDILLDVFRHEMKTPMFGVLERCCKVVDQARHMKGINEEEIMEVVNGIKNVWQSTFMDLLRGSFRIPNPIRGDIIIFNQAEAEKHLIEWG